jgi:hypothetical protein
VLPGDPYWAYELYDLVHGEFSDTVDPDTAIPVSSVDLLIYKENSMLDEECPALGVYIRRLHTVASRISRQSSSTVQSSSKRG